MNSGSTALRRNLSPSSPNPMLADQIRERSRQLAKPLNEVEQDIRRRMHVDMPLAPASFLDWKEQVTEE